MIGFLNHTGLSAQGGKPADIQKLIPSGLLLRRIVFMTPVHNKDNQFFR